MCVKTKHCFAKIICSYHIVHTLVPFTYRDATLRVSSSASYALSKLFHLYNSHSSIDRSTATRSVQRVETRLTVRHNYTYPTKALRTTIIDYMKRFSQSAFEYLETWYSFSFGNPSFLNCLSNCISWCSTKNESKSITKNYKRFRINMYHWNFILRSVRFNIGHE